MKKRLVVTFLIGALFGTMVPKLWSDDDFLPEIHTYMSALKRAIIILIDIDSQLKKIEENTRRFK